MRGVVSDVVSKIRPARRPDLIFVLGSQRSGTNALRRSLSLDPWVMGFNERASSELYERWKLRPEPEIRDFLARCVPHKVLLKPIQSVFKTPVAEFLAPFEAYDLTVAWIYRDPVAVFRSRAARWSDRNDVGPFVREWNRINSSPLDAKDPRIAIVSYDRLLAGGPTFGALNRFLRIRGDNLFRETRSPASVVEEVGDANAERIRAETAETLHELNAAADAFLARWGSALPPEEPGTSDDLNVDGDGHGGHARNADDQAEDRAQT